MKTADSTAVVRQFGRYLSLVEAGGSVRITKHGRPVARLVPDQRFMTGAEFYRVFAGYKAGTLDKAAAKEIAKNISQLDADSDHALAH